MAGKLSETTDVTTISAETSPNGSSLGVRIGIDSRGLRVLEGHLGSRVMLAGWPRTGQVGGPGLPTRTIWLALPAGTVLQGAISTEVTGQVQATTGPTTLAPIRGPRRDVPEPARSRTPSLELSTRLYQAERQRSRPLARFLGTERIGSTTIAAVELCPFLLGPDGSLRLATGLQVTLPLASAPASRKAESQADAITPVSAAQFGRLEALAKTVVANPEQVAGHRVTRTLAQTWDYVIITDDVTWDAATMKPGTPVVPGLVAAFGPLVAWKSSLGFHARVVTVTEIVASRPGTGLGADFVAGAADLQQAIRNFLRWAHNNWGTAYVLIGGDTHVVPVRSLEIGSGYYPSMPTDLYYAALNPLNDGWAEGQAIKYGSFGFSQLMPDLSLGRAAVSDGTQAATFTAKVTGYERLGTTDNDLYQPWLHRMLFVATKWGGDDQIQIQPSPTYPPGDDHFASDAPGQYAVIKLIDKVMVTQDPNAATTSPGYNRFNKAPGLDHVKIHLAPTYKDPQSIDVVTATGTTTLAYTDKADKATPGWYYTDWTDNDGPCHDASGKNYPTTWIIVHLDASVVPQAFVVHLRAALRLDYNLLSQSGPGSFQYIPFDIRAAQTRNGWCFAKSAADRTPSPVDATGHQIPTAWLVVYASPPVLAPTAFVLDPAEEADTQSEQEELRKTINKAMPAWNIQAALYPDAVDLPPSDRGSIDAQYYTRARLLAKLNQGQHIVSVGAHGNPWGTCYAGGVDPFDCGVADQLTNGLACGIMFANSCLTNRFTEDSLSRHLVVKNAKGGFASYIGYADVISIGLGNAVEKKFFADLSKTAILGHAFDARASMVVPGSGFDVTSADVRYTIFMMALQGDPALRVHGAGPEYLVANCVSPSRDANGAIDVIYLTPEQKIAHVAQGPAGWQRAALIDPGSWASQIAAVANADGRLEVFYVGSDHKIYHIWQTAPNNGWSQSVTVDPGSWASQVTAVPNADGRLEVFYIGSDHKIYHVWQTRPNGGWSQSGVLDPGSWASQLAPSRNADGRLEVFYVGSDHKIYHIWQTAPNNGWTGSCLLEG